MAVLCLTFRLLGDTFHGRGDGGEPEWPPSPLRAFQALVAAAAGRWRGTQFADYAGPALRWLEGLGAPEVCAPVGRVATRPYRLYVPNNAGDLMVSAWARGDTDADMSSHRTEKDVRPVRLADGAAVHYLYRLPDGGAGAHLETLKAAARAVTHLGWGVDMAAGDAAVLSAEAADALPGERWRPADGADGTQLRVPLPGTLAAVNERHRASLNRLPVGGGFVPVPPLTAFDTKGYCRDTDPAPRPWAAFAILKPDASGNRSFDTARRTRDVAGWVRHAVAGACADWPDSSRFVHGHAVDGTQAAGDGADDRLMYLPLPTVNPALGRVESIRRVLVAAPAGFRERVEQLRHRVTGCELVAEPDPSAGAAGDSAGPRPAAAGRVVGLLKPLPTSDWVLGQYVGRARVWSTVTPVLRPGFDDRDPKKGRKLLEAAFVQAGFPPALVAAARLEWRAVGFRAGVDHVREYDPPDRLRRFPRFHIRVAWPVAVPGPIAVGAGRYRGFGVFVADRD